MSEVDHASEQVTPYFPTITSQTAITEQKPHAASDQSVHRDLHQIIARAREEIHRLREQRAKMEADAAALIQERDDLAQRYADLEQHFLETVHVAAEEKIRRIADELDPLPRQVPPLLEPVADALSRWVEQQQREREAQLLLLLERAEQHLEGVHQQSEQERAALEADKARLAQQRKDFETQMELRRAALKHRWLARTWLTGSVMFLLFPALEIYLLTHGAQVASAIIISTAICLVLIALVGLVRSRRTPKTTTPAPTKRPGE